MLGDAEALPFADDSFDRYVSAGSIEYWPDPQRGLAEAYRVTRSGGTALMIGPVRPANRVARALAETWMLFPAVEEYTGWMETAGFTDVQVRELAPDWYRDERAPYALAVTGVKPAPGPSPAASAAPVAEEPVSRCASPPASSRAPRPAPRSSRSPPSSRCARGARRGADERARAMPRGAPPTRALPRGDRRRDRPRPRARTRSWFCGASGGRTR